MRRVASLCIKYWGGGVHNAPPITYTTLITSPVTECTTPSILYTVYCFSCLDLLLFPITRCFHWWWICCYTRRSVLPSVPFSHLLVYTCYGQCIPQALISSQSVHAWWNGYALVEIMCWLYYICPVLVNILLQTRCAKPPCVVQTQLSKLTRPCCLVEPELSH